MSGHARLPSNQQRVDTFRNPTLQIPSPLMGKSTTDVKDPVASMSKLQRISTCTSSLISRATISSIQHMLPTALLLEPIGMLSTRTGARRPATLALSPITVPLGNIIPWCHRIQQLITSYLTMTILGPLLQELPMLSLLASQLWEVLLLPQPACGWGPL